MIDAKIIEMTNALKAIEEVQLPSEVKTTIKNVLTQELNFWLKRKELYEVQYEHVTEETRHK